MKRLVQVYVAVVTLLSIALLAIVYRVWPAMDASSLTAVVWFASLGVIAHALGHQMSRGTFGAITFIPFLAGALVAPNWIAVVGVGIAVLIGEALTDRHALKRAFNIAQHCLAIALAILAFRGAGGHAMAVGDALGLPHVTMLAVFLATNTLAVSGVIAVSEGRNLWQVWRKNTSATLAYDLLSLPIVFLFAWIYVRYGAAWTSALAVPLLGVRQLYKTNWQLEQVNQEMLQLMVAAIEARDPYTSGHSRRVSHNAKIIARTLGVGGRQVDRIGVAALLHDVGKIHEVFAPILRKPDRLTPEERAIMETHPIKSAELVQNASQLKDLIAPIRHHHENWDGSGYPDGIAGDAIPLAARIIMFADTIDAMTTDRPYRLALGESDVRRELTRLRGRQFDPTICDVLLQGTTLSHLVRTQTSALTPPFGLQVTDPKRPKLRVQA